MTPSTTRPGGRSAARTPAGRDALRGLALAVLADLVCVTAFAFGGKSSHEAHDSDLVVVAIVWPFALAAVLAHAGLAARGGRPWRVRPEGLVVLVATYVVGMVLRWLSGRGIAPGFLVVAAIFLAITMLGWRAVVTLVARRRS